MTSTLVSLRIVNSIAVRVQQSIHNTQSFTHKFKQWCTFETHFYKRQNAATPGDKESKIKETISVLDRPPDQLPTLTTIYWTIRLDWGVCTLCTVKAVAGDNEKGGKP